MSIVPRLSNPTLAQGKLSYILCAHTSWACRWLSLESVSFSLPVTSQPAHPSPESPKLQFSAWSCWNPASLAWGWGTQYNFFQRNFPNKSLLFHFYSLAVGDGLRSYLTEYYKIYQLFIVARILCHNLRTSMVYNNVHIYCLCPSCGRLGFC